METIVFQNREGHLAPVFDRVAVVGKYAFGLNTKTNEHYLLLASDRMVYMGMTDTGTQLRRCIVDGVLRVWSVEQARRFAPLVEPMEFVLAQHALTQSPEKFSANTPGLDPDFAMTRSLDTPLLAAMTDEAGECVLIDGYHRVYKAMRLGVKTLYAHFLPLPLAVRCEVPCDILDLLQGGGQH